jgi:hypothetical protein
MLKRTGTSLTEYTLCSLVIIGGSLAGLLLLRDSIYDLVSNMIGSPNRVAASSIGKTAPKPSKIEASKATETIKVKLPGDVALDFNSPTNIPEGIKTNGANGTTEILASSLEDMVQKLLDADQITPEDASSIIRLANQAHHLATIQKELESIVEQYGDSKDLLANTPVMIDGKAYANVYIAAQAVGLTEDNKPGSELQEFWNLFSEAYGDNYDWPPELLQLLQDHATAISDVSDSLRVSLKNILVYKAGEPSNLRNMMAEQVTRKESAKICHLENGNMDDGSRCSRN